VQRSGTREEINILAEVESLRRPGRVPVDTGTAAVLASLGQAVLTSIVFGVAACIAL
jgi:hypothetical protein